MEHLKLLVHISEPWDFERRAGTPDLSGWTSDHLDPENFEWEVHLITPFKYEDHIIHRLLVEPHYADEKLGRIHDMILAAVPVAISRLVDDEWVYDMKGSISLDRREPEDDAHQNRPD